MRLPSIVPGVVIVIALSLAACAPSGPAVLPAGDPSDAPTASGSASPGASATPEPPAEDLGLLRVSTRVTATDNGAALDLQLVVREVIPVGSPELKKFWAQVDEICRVFEVPDDYRDGPVTVIEGTAQQVPGTPAWPKSQWLYWMTLDVSTLAIGDGFEQSTSVTKIGERVECEGSTWAVSSGTSTLYYWSAASQSLSGPDPEKALAFNQYGWFADTGGPHAKTALSNCVVEVPASTTARVEAAGYHWVEFATSPDFADLDGCGVGVGNEAFD
jgi:hypothetical protein